MLLGWWNIQHEKRSLVINTENFQYQKKNQKTKKPKKKEKPNKKILEKIIVYNNKSNSVILKISGQQISESQWTVARKWRSEEVKKWRS